MFQDFISPSGILDEEIDCETLPYLRQRAIGREKEEEDTQGSIQNSTLMVQPKDRVNS
jgi:hypothetical protein